MADNKIYTRTTWEDGVTPLNADNMNNIENGIEAAATLEGKNVFAGLNTFKAGIEINSLNSSGKTLSMFADPDATNFWGYKALDSSEMPAGVSLLTARFLRLETKDMARADYEANDIKYGNITTTMTLKFPAIDIATTTKTIATEESVDTKIQTALGTVEAALEQIDTGTGV